MHITVNLTVNGCASVDSTLALAVDATLLQLSIRRLHNRRIDACTTVESTPVQPSIRRLYNCQIDSCTTVDLIFDFKL